MATINFVPDDYVQQRQANRANILNLMLLVAMLGAIGITFGFIKVRQKSVETELTQLNEQLKEAKQQIAQIEVLEAKKKTVLKTMVMTAELLEPVPRSIILASLTNNLPSGVSLLQFELEEKESKTYRPASKTTSSSQYKNKSKATAAATAETETNIETDLTLKGIAPSDIQVASYIAQLSNSILFDNVSLVESKEVEIDEIKLREFRLNARIKPDLALSREDIDRIREKREREA